MIQSRKVLPGIPTGLFLVNSRSSQADNQEWPSQSPMGFGSPASPVILPFIFTVSGQLHKWPQDFYGKCPMILASSESWFFHSNFFCTLSALRSGLLASPVNLTLLCFAWLLQLFRTLVNASTPGYFVPAKLSVEQNCHVLLEAGAMV